MSRVLDIGFAVGASIIISVLCYTMIDSHLESKKEKQIELLERLYQMKGDLNYKKRMHDLDSLIEKQEQEIENIN